ncbi:hypothetical protein DV736_g1133, partial [Chaetothyriales sp. CBS 134916]
MSELLNEKKAPLPDVERAKGLDVTGQKEDSDELAALGYKAELHRNRSVYTILFQVLAITAVPFGEGTALTSAIYGGGQLAYFVGWIVVVVLDECVAVSLSELASKFPTSSGPYYWSYQLLPEGHARTVLSFITGWVWVIGNLTICLSVNFGTASLLAGTATIYHPDWFASDWQLLLIFYAVCIGTFLACALGNRILPYVDTVASVWNGITILIVCIALSATADVGRHSASYALSHYDKSFSGWGNFTFFIGLLPAAYTFAAIGMITSMAEEVADPAKEVPTALSLVVPISGIAGLFFILPICFTMPALADVLNAPAAQALPYIFHVVMGSPGGGLALMFFVLGVAIFCCISITTAASRTTWAFALYLGKTTEMDVELTIQPPFRFSSAAISFVKGHFFGIVESASVFMFITEYGDNPFVFISLVESIAAWWIHEYIEEYNRQSNSCVVREEVGTDTEE